MLWLHDRDCAVWMTNQNIVSNISIAANSDEDSLPEQLIATPAA